MSYSDNNAGGLIAVDEVLSENNYYPFGLQHQGDNPAVAQANKAAEKYKYNSKELQDELSLNFYDYGAALGRWMNVDPLAEVQAGWTPFHYVSNSPINRIDPTGMLDHEYDKGGNLISNLGGDKVDFHHQEDGSVRITDIESGESTSTKKGSDVIEGFVHRDSKVKWETIYNEFKIGNGPKRSLMDGEHPMIIDMKDSQAASVARKMYVENGGKKGYKAFDFGISGAILAGTNRTEQMIGSAGVSVYPVGENVVIMLTDTKTPRSLFLHLPNVSSRYN